MAATTTRHWETTNVNAGVLIEPIGLGNVSFEGGFSGKLAPEVPSSVTSVNSRVTAVVVYPLVSLINHSCDPNLKQNKHMSFALLVLISV